MSFDWNIFSSIATIITTLIGFVVTYRLTKRNLRDELQKSKAMIGLENMEDIPFQLLQMLDDVKAGKLSAENYAKLIHKIYAYGSNDAIKILVCLQRTNYEYAKQPSAVKESPNFRPLTLLSLLISQIKYDLTGELVKPEGWFILRITDYQKSGMKKNVQDLINNDVLALALNKNFLT